MLLTRRADRLAVRDARDTLDGRMPDGTWLSASAFVDAWLLRACAQLGIKLVHSQPVNLRAGGR